MDAYARGDDLRNVLMGTCGWTDDTLLRCGKFYPSSVKTAVDRLRHYSRHYSTVEIDTSTYAIPRPHQIKEWMAVVPKGFIFHIKIFGLFPSRSIAPGALPRDIRAEYLTPEMEAKTNIKLHELPPACVDALWGRMNDAIRTLHEGGMLGVVVCQFHGTFLPTPENIAYVAECRRRLLPEFHMAVEFRNRDWYASTPPTAVLPEEVYDAAPEGVPPLPERAAGQAWDTQKHATLHFMRRLNIINIASDDLVSEFPAHEPRVPGYRDGRALIFDDVTSPDCALIRLHRRVGTDRLLSQPEVDEWALRMQQMAATGCRRPFHWCDPALLAQQQGQPGVGEPANSTSLAVAAPPDHPWLWTHLRGPIFFMIGTDHEDQPMKNMKALQAALTRDLPAWSDSAALHGEGATTTHGIPVAVRAAVLDWRAIARTADAKTGLAGFFQKQVAAAATDGHTGAAHAAKAGTEPTSMDGAAVHAGMKRAREDQGDSASAGEAKGAEDAAVALSSREDGAHKRAEVVENVHTQAGPAEVVDISGASDSDGGTQGSAHRAAPHRVVNTTPSRPAATAHRGSASASPRPRPAAAGRSKLPAASAGQAAAMKAWLGGGK